MSRARANIQDINAFKVNAEKEGEIAEQVNSALQDIDNINAEIDNAITKIEGSLSQCEQAETNINSVVDELQQKYDEIQAKLDALISSEPTPAEELITECDYDSEVNITSSYSYWQETAAHSAWASEVASVEAGLSAVGAKLGTAQSLQEKIQNKIDELTKVIDTLNNVKNNNENYKKLLSEYCQEIIDSSQSASTQLKNALAALELYLTEMVNIVSSPLCANFSWGYGNSNAKIERKFTTKTAREIVDEKEFKQNKEFYTYVDTMDISPYYKDILIERYADMDRDLKQLFNRYARKMKCVDVNCLDKEGRPHAFFSPKDGGIRFHQTYDSDNPLGPGNTFFHESGHALDKLLGNENGSSETASYKNYMTEAAHEDYYDAIDKIMREEKCDEAKAQELLTTELKNNPIISNVVSDIFGGISYNKVHGRWTHDTEKYWKIMPRDVIGREAFAEITAEIACKNEETLNFTQKYLPRTMQRYREILQGVKK